MSRAFCSNSHREATHLGYSLVALSVLGFSRFPVSRHIARQTLIVVLPVLILLLGFVLASFRFRLFEYSGGSTVPRHTASAKLARLHPGIQNLYCVVLHRTPRLPRERLAVGGGRARGSLEADISVTWRLLGFQR
jgi:hypothetical protein